MKRIVAFFACGMLAIAAQAQVSDLILKGLIDKSVIIERNDGSTLSCKLLSFDQQDIAVADEGGKVFSISRTVVKGARIDTSAEPAGAMRASDRPLGPRYFLFDPLGFIEVGPAIEYGLRIGPSVTLGAGLRVDGLGYLYRTLAAGDGGASISIASISGSVSSSQFFSSTASNRWYLSETIEYGGGSSTNSDYYGDFTNHWMVIKAYLGFGHRWRNPSGFFFDLGLQAGVANSIDPYYTYDSSPGTRHETDSSTFAAGMVQLRLGWELGAKEVRM